MKRAPCIDKEWKKTIISFLRIELSLFVKPLVSSLTDALCQVWMKLAKRLWRSFLSFVDIFSLFRTYFPLEKSLALYLKTFNPLHLKMLCVQFVAIGSVVLEKKIKIWKVYRRTTGDQKSPLELSAQVSLKMVNSQREMWALDSSIQFYVKFKIVVMDYI